MRAGRTLVPAVVLLIAAGGAGCGRSADKVKAPEPRKGASSAARYTGDALFLAEAPVVVPEELEPELDAMKIGRIYAAGATLMKTGQVVSAPPPPSKIHRPVVLVVTAEPGAEQQLASASGALLGETWGAGIEKAVIEARKWSDVVGVHLHMMPDVASLPTLAPALKAIHRITALPVSVTVSSELAPESLKPLAGAADEILVMSFGRRPETNDRMVPELSEAAARDEPLPIRLLIVPGGYGIAGGSGRRVPDGEADPLSENRALDFDFGVLSAEVGNIFGFRARSGDLGKNPFQLEGGSVKFHVLSSADLVRFLGDVAKWGPTPLVGRVFLIDGVPKDGHMLGYPIVSALLTGRSVEPKLDLDLSPGPAGRSWSEFSIVATNVGPSPSELSHFNNWVQLRVEGGTIAAVREGDFDRYALLSSEKDGGRPMSYGRATTCRLFENLFAPGESNVAGPIRVAGAHPRVYMSYQLALAGGTALRGPEVTKPLAEPRPEPPPRKRR